MTKKRPNRDRIMSNRDKQVYKALPVADCRLPKETLKEKKEKELRRESLFSLNHKN